MIFYSLNGTEVTAVLTTLYGLYCGTEGKKPGGSRKTGRQIDRLKR
jgi:hypothetical protein